MIVCENIDRFLFPAYVNIFIYIHIFYLCLNIYIYICFFRPRFCGRCSFDQHLLEETALRTYLKHSYWPHMQEGMSLPFVFPKTVSCVTRSSMHLQSVFLDDCL